jgi:hypothetical protein
MDDHGMRMASCHWKLLEKILKYRRKMLQFLRCSFLQNPHLWISFKDFYPMRSRRDLSSKIFAWEMSVHVNAFGPERALRNIINIPLKGNIDRVPILPVESQQFFRSYLFHLTPYPPPLSPRLRVVPTSPIKGEGTLS